MGINISGQVLTCGRKRDSVNYIKIENKIGANTYYKRGCRKGRGVIVMGKK